MNQKRVLSGVQPTGDVHIGNWLGAIRNWVELQENYETFVCVVDLHAITTPHDPKSLYQNSLSTAALYIACGMDPNKCSIFIQSQISAHSELCWILNCLTPLNWMERMIQFKEKSIKQGDNVSIGLLDYPVLMAADIVLYDADLVPVGEDQKQHLELTRDIAQKFNNDFKTDLFPIPEPLIFGEATRVMSLRDGTKKMSKSDPSDYSRIMLSDNLDSIVQKIKKAKTDAYPLPSTLDEAKKRPEALNLITIFAALNNVSTDSIIETYAGREFSSFKKDLAELSVEKINPISSEIKKLMEDELYLDKIMKKGKEKAILVAEPVIRKVYDIIGFSNT